MLSFFKKKEPTPAEFAELMRKRLAKAGVRGEMTFNAEDFSLVLDAKRVVYLGNIFEHYMQSKGREREAQLDRFIRGMLATTSHEMPTSIEAARAQLFPIVRERLMFEQMRHKVDDPAMLAYLPWVGNLCLAVAYDSPDAMATITGEQLKNWGLTLEEALDLGRHNLGGMTTPQFVELEGGVFIAGWDDDYGSSRLLLPHLWNALPIAGDVVAICTNRNRTFATGEQNEAGLGMILKLAQQSLQEPRAMRPTPMVLRSGKWEAFHYQGANAELREGFAMMALQTLGGEYEEQKALHDHLNQQAGRDIFIASFSAVKNPETGALTSYCTWVMGLDSRLPRTDQIAIVDPDLGQEKGMLGMADWQDVVNQPGVTFAPQGDYPERYLPTGRPSNDFLARLSP